MSQPRTSELEKIQGECKIVLQWSTHFLNVSFVIFHTSSSDRNALFQANRTIDIA